MNGLFIIYDVAYDDEVVNILDSINVKGFTKWTKVIGRGANSNPKMDDPVWPGFNCMIFLAVADELKNKLLDNIKMLLDKKNITGIKIFEFPIKELI